MNLLTKRLELCKMDQWVASENSRPSSLPAQVAFRETPLGQEQEGKEGRLFSQANQ